MEKKTRHTWIMAAQAAALFFLLAAPPVGATSAGVNVEVGTPVFVSVDTRPYIPDVSFSEDSAGTLQEGDAFTLEILTPGVEWSAGLSGEELGAGLIHMSYALDADRNLVVTVDRTASGVPGKVVFSSLRVKVFPEAHGDIKIRITFKGTAALEPITVVVATVGEKYSEVTVENTTDESIFSPDMDKEIDAIVIQTRERTFSASDSILLTLSRNAQWCFVDAAPNDGVPDCIAKMEHVKYVGLFNCYRTLWLQISGTDTDTIRLKGLTVMTPPGVTGAISVRVNGECGADDTVSAGKILHGYEAESGGASFIFPGLGLGGGDITIRELVVSGFDAGDAGDPVNDDRYDDLWLELPSGVTWACRPVVRVNGDQLAAGNVDIAGPLCYVQVKGIHNSWLDDITVSGIKYDITGTVPDHEVVVNIGGDVLNRLDDLGSDSIRDENAENYAICPMLSCINGTGKLRQQSTTVFAIASKTYVKDGFSYLMDVAPEIRDGRTCMPVRYVAEALDIRGTDIMWGNSTATFIKGGKVVQVSAGSREMFVNNSVIAIDTVPYLKDGRMMLPVRWLATAFGADITWNPAAQTIIVNR